MFPPAHEFEYLASNRETVGALGSGAPLEEYGTDLEIPSPGSSPLSASRSLEL